MKTKLLNLILTFVFSSMTINAQTTLSSGDIAVIYHLAETTNTVHGATANVDRIGLVLLKDITTNTTFKVTENGSNNGTSLELDEGVIVFTAQANHSAGTVIDLVSYDQLSLGRTSNIPLITDGNPSVNYAMSTGGDQTIVYTGSEAAPNFIYSAFFDGTSWDSVADCAGNCSGTESVEPSSGVTFAYGAGPTSEFDNNWYTGPTTFNTPAEMLAAINNPANWTGDNNNNGSGETAADALVTSGFTINSLSVDDFNIDKVFDIYPNPTTGIITIKNTKAIPLKSIQIMDVNGRLIKNIELDNFTENKTLDLQSLSKGMYFVKIYSDNNSSTTKKFILQ